MTLRSLFLWHKGKRVPRPCVGRRPAVEALEDRSLPSGLVLPSPPAAASGLVRAARPDPVQGQHVTITGTLHSPVVAIGGETTGTIVETEGGQVYELKVRGRAGRERAERLDGQRVTVSGTLTIVPGVEVPDRHVIRVDTLEPAAAERIRPSTRPPAERPPPVEVFATVFFPEVAPGGVSEVEWGVANVTDDTPVSVRIRGEITYADGARETFRLFRRPVTLEPGFGVGVIMLFLVPDDAASGEATFTVTAQARRLTGGTGLPGLAHPVVVTQTATFTVL
jgi:hypothetical protein